MEEDGATGDVPTGAAGGTAKPEEGSAASFNLVLSRGFVTGTAQRIQSALVELREFRVRLDSEQREFDRDWRACAAEAMARRGLSWCTSCKKLVPDGLRLVRISGRRRIRNGPASTGLVPFTELHRACSACYEGFSVSHDSGCACGHLGTGEPYLILEDVIVGDDGQMRLRTGQVIMGQWVPEPPLDAFDAVAAEWGLPPRITVDQNGVVTEFSASPTGSGTGPTTT